MNTLLLIFSFVVFSGMIITIILTYGIQKSISESYYRFNKVGKVLFTFAIWGFVIPLIIVADSALFMTAGGLLCFVAAAPNFKANKIELDTHMFGAFGGIILSFISLWIDFNLWPISIVFILLTVFFYLMRDVLKYIWWVEVLAFYLILIGLTIAKF